MSEVRPFYHQERLLLQGLSQATSLPAALHDRLQMIGLAQQGLPRHQIAEELAYTTDTVAKWCARFNEHGVLGLFDAPRSGAPRQTPVDAVLRVLESATARPSDRGLPFPTWTLNKLRRYLAEQHQIQLSREGLRQLLARHGLSWKKARSWQHSHDPCFAQKREAIVTLYTDPPPGALVLCLDQVGPLLQPLQPADGHLVLRVAAAPAAGGSGDLPGLGQCQSAHGPRCRPLAGAALSRPGAGAVHAEQGRLAESDRSLVDDVQPGCVARRRIREQRAVPRRGPRLPGVLQCPADPVRVGTAAAPALLPGGAAAPGRLTRARSGGQSQRSLSLPTGTRVPDLMDDALAAGAWAMQPV